MGRLVGEPAKVGDAIVEAGARERPFVNPEKKSVHSLTCDPQRPRLAARAAEGGRRLNPQARWIG